MPLGPEEGGQSPRAEVTGDCELPYVSTGKQMGLSGAK